MKYRPEIDGLRALAVVPVILFHAGLPGFSGGYVGVDVFFVISGYLITSILLEDLQRDRFSIATFYERRARRILPALIVVVAACVPFAWLWLPPRPFDEFTESVIGVAFFISNFKFWSQSGYFALAAEQKPLLHTWSLAVEEQFYLFYPPILYAIWHYCRSWMVRITLLNIAASLMLAELGWRYFPDANFFLPFSRIWELGAGALCAVYLHKHSASKPRFDQIAPGLGGLALIAIAVFFFDENTPFPSVWAVIPVAGTAIVILFARTGTPAARLLSLQPLVGIGLISYSAYLWHQPLFAFARVRFGDDVSPILIGSLAAFTLVLAWLSWRYVETPFRNRDKVSKRQTWQYAAVALIATAAIGQTGKTYFDQQYKFFIAALPQEVRENIQLITSTRMQGREPLPDDKPCVFSAFWPDEAFIQRYDSCVQTGNKAIVLLGDSHSENIFTGLVQNVGQPFLVGLQQGGCRPGVTKRTCNFAEIVSFLESRKETIKRIVYHQSGSHLIADGNGEFESDAMFEGLGDYIFSEEKVRLVQDFLNTMPEGPQIVWLGPFTEYRGNFEPKTLATEKLNPIAVEASAHIDEKVAEMVQADPHRRYRYVDINPMLKDLFESLIYENGCMMFQDEDHLSRCGARLVGERLVKLDVFN